MTLNQSIQEVEKALQNFIQTMPEHSLYSPVEYLLNLGGKRLRPALAILSNAYFNGELEHISAPALAVEVFHNFSLMHDDIMDNAPLRRGEQTVHEKWDDNTAILSGDAMLVQAYQLIIKTAPEYIVPLNELFSRTALEVCEGQQLDMEFETRNDVSIPDYLEMIKLKTSVLLACALEMGAITAGASVEDRKSIYEYGLNMGIAFQLRDDYLDAFGTSHKVGKQKGGDIIANKKTYLALRAWDKADQGQKDKFWELYSEHDSAKKVAETLELFQELEVDKDLLSLSEDYYTKAVQCLNETSGETTVKDELLAFSESLMGREF